MRTDTLNLSAFQEFLHHHMPLTRFMGLQVKRFDETELQLFLPLHNNHNDKGTAFGGSTAAAMIVAGWSLVHLSLHARNMNADVVIYRNSSQWLRPLRADATVVAHFQSQTGRQHWGRRRQRVGCEVQIVDEAGQLYSQMQADYVIMPAKNLGVAMPCEAIG